MRAWHATEGRPRQPPRRKGGAGGKRARNQPAGAARGTDSRSCRPNEMPLVDQRPQSFPEFERFEHLCSWVNKPEMANPFARVDAALSAQVQLARRGREHFANPVGRDREVRRVGILGHRLSPPTREIGNNDVCTFAAEMQFRFVDDPPAAGAVITKVKWRCDLGPDPRTCPRMPCRRPWMGMEGSGDHLGDPVGRRVEHVLIGGPASGLCRHDPCFSLAWFHDQNIRKRSNTGPNDTSLSLWALR